MRIICIGFLFHLLSSIITINNSYASFTVEPLKLSINLNNMFGNILIKNQNRKQLFMIKVTLDGKEESTKELIYSPTNFELLPYKTQIVRIMLKPGINYTAKKYNITIKTDEDNPNIVGTPNGFVIPIIVNNILPNDVEIINKIDRQDEKETNAILNNSRLDKLEGLTQIKITIPIKATIK